MAKVFRVEMLPALNGDCIWVEYGEAPATRHVLIDGGPLGAFGALKARIGRLGGGPKQIELFVITHIDDDHIAGAVKLLNHGELDLAFRDIWFNGWEQLRWPITGAGSQAMPAEAVRSPAQGQYLALRLEKRNEPWNRWFYGRAAMVPDYGPLPRVRLNGDLELILLSPNAQKLIKLQTAWAKNIRARFKVEPENNQFFRDRLDKDVRYRGAETIPVAPDSVAQAIDTDLKADDSVPNGSSIAFVAQYGGKRCAFLGDAHMDVVEPALARLAKEMGVKRVPLDAVKVSHHGSAGNITPSFLKAIDCRRFLISTDGSNGFEHPDAAAIECVLTVVPGARLYFNYRSESNGKWELECKSSGYSTVYPQPGAEGVELDLFADDLLHHQHG